MPGVMAIPAFPSLIDFWYFLIDREVPVAKKTRKGGLHLLKDDKTKSSKGQSSQNGWHAAEPWGHDYSSLSQSCRFLIFSMRKHQESTRQRKSGFQLLKQNKNIFIPSFDPALPHLSVHWQPFLQFQISQPFPVLSTFGIFDAEVPGINKTAKVWFPTTLRKQERLYTIFRSKSSPSFSSLATLHTISDTPAFRASFTVVSREVRDQSSSLPEMSSVLRSGCPNRKKTETGSNLTGKDRTAVSGC